MIFGAWRSGGVEGGVKVESVLSKTARVRRQYPGNARDLAEVLR